MYLPIYMYYTLTIIVTSNTSMHTCTCHLTASSAWCQYLSVTATHTHTCTCTHTHTHTHAHVHTHTHTHIVHSLIQLPFSHYYYYNTIMVSRKIKNKHVWSFWWVKIDNIKISTIEQTVFKLFMTVTIGSNLQSVIKCHRLMKFIIPCHLLSA